MRKPLYSEYYLKNKIRATKEALKNKKQKRLYVQTMSRRSAIRPEWLGITFLVHNGQRYVKVNVTNEMIGHKLGEFVATRKRHIFKKGKKK